MNVIRYKPFENDLFSDFLAPFRALDEGFLKGPAAANRPWTPAVDIFENEHEVVLKADLPEVNEKDIEVKLENGTLTLKGERKFENTESTKGYQRIERSYGAFVRYFTVPETLDPEKVQAEYKAGVLTVTLPKKEVAKPRSIPVTIKAN
ncbi:MAG: Hsp20/alpha crystallin family protein [Bryobacteraceae bacterium]|nr:Hsp20/alpha crystallin family protein [Bryobacteraceae bacterium]